MSGSGIEAVEISGQVVPLTRHFHSYYVVGLIIRGARIMSAEGGQYPVCTGDMMLLNPCQVHACVAASDAPFAYRALHIAQTQMEAMTECAAPRFTAPVLKDAAVAEDFLRAYERDSCRPAFLRRLSREHMRRGPHEPVDTRFEAACAYLREHFRRGVTVSELSGFCGCSRSYLLHSFTRELGIPPGAYQEALRVECAQEGLRRGMSPLEAGMEAGFCDQSHFTRFFKRFTGMTPAYYQRMIGERTHE